MSAMSSFKALPRSLAIGLLCCYCVPCTAFTAGSKARCVAPQQKIMTRPSYPWHPEIGYFASNKKPLSTSALHMYNLPPSGGGGNNGFKEILASVGTLALIIAFFASPLGGLFFALLNSFFVLSLVLPVFLWIAFQGWQFFNTIEGPCPQCGAPVRVLKENDSPNICLNCGTFVQATPDKSSVDFYREEDQVIVDEGYTASIWDNLMSGPMGARSAPTTKSPQERQSQYRRDQTVIDVEIDDRD